MQISPTNIKGQWLSVQDRHKTACVKQGSYKNRKLHFRQVFHRAYSAYIQAGNQAIKDQKPIKKVQKSRKTKKKNQTQIERFSQKYAQKNI